MMALQDELKAFFTACAMVVRNFFHAILTKSNYIRHILIAMSIGIVLAISYMGYQSFAISRDQKAQKAFAEYMYDYQLAMKENNPQEWDRVAALFQFGRNQYRSTSLAPYFLVVQADIELQQGKRTQAIATLAQAVSELSDVTMKSLVSIKRAFMQLDSDQALEQEKGMQELLSLARDKNNPYYDMALFYAGRYYWQKNALSEAQKVWQELVDSSSVDSMNKSPWVYEAQTLVQQLNK